MTVVQPTILTNLNARHITATDDDKQLTKVSRVTPLTLTANPMFPTETNQFAVAELTF